jgi:hypothetical protein
MVAAKRRAQSQQADPVDPGRSRDSGINDRRESLSCSCRHSSGNSWFVPLSSVSGLTYLEKLFFLVFKIFIMLLSYLQRKYQSFSHF